MTLKRQKPTQADNIPIEWRSALTLLTRILTDHLIADINAELTIHGQKRRPMIFLSASFYRKLKEALPESIYFNLFHGEARTLLGLPVLISIDQASPYVIRIIRAIDDR